MMLKTYISLPTSNTHLQEESDEIIRALTDTHTHLEIRDIRVIPINEDASILQINYTGYYVEET